MYGVPLIDAEFLGEIEGDVVACVVGLVGRKASDATTNATLVVLPTSIDEEVLGKVGHIQLRPRVSFAFLPLTGGRGNASRSSYPDGGVLLHEAVILPGKEGKDGKDEAPKHQDKGENVQKPYS